MKPWVAKCCYHHIAGWMRKREGEKKTFVFKVNDRREVGKFLTRCFYIGPELYVLRLIIANMEGSTIVNLSKDTQYIHKRGL